MADKLKQEAGVEPGLIQGRGGVFKVRVDGRVVAEKSALTGFPSEDEVVAAVKRALAG